MKKHNILTSLTSNSHSCKHILNKVEGQRTHCIDLQLHCEGNMMGNCQTFDISHDSF